MAIMKNTESHYHAFLILNVSHFIHNIHYMCLKHNSRQKEIHKLIPKTFKPDVVNHIR